MKFKQIILNILVGTAGLAATLAPSGSAFATDASKLDYARPEMWAALPSMKDAADVVPAGSTLADAQADAQADVFYIYPTTDNGNEPANSAVPNQAVDSWTDTSVISRQASAFNACCRVFAPRYRQATMMPGVADRQVRLNALAFAYEDVKAAFEYYLAHHNNGRPIILAGHSQGAFHIYRLLDELFEGKPLRQRLVAAYAVGIPIFNDAFGVRYKTISACSSATQTGCIVSWNTYIEGSDAAAYTARAAQDFAGRYSVTPTQEILCTNPLTFDLSKPNATADQNLGTLQGEPGDALALKVGAVAAACRQGILFIDRAGASALQVKAMPGGFLHMYDVQLFFENLRQNAVQRVRAFSKAAR